MTAHVRIVILLTLLYVPIKTPSINEGFTITCKNHKDEVIRSEKEGGLTNCGWTMPVVKAKCTKRAKGEEFQCLEGDSATNNIPLCSSNTECGFNDMFEKEEYVKCIIQSNGTFGECRKNRQNQKIPNHSEQIKFHILIIAIPVLGLFIV